MRIRSYSELRHFDSLESRFDYLKLNGRVGDSTFGFDRFINQMFYRSAEWRAVRRHVIIRDEGCDLGIPGHDIHKGLYIHHMNPMTVDEISSGDLSILDPEYLITVTHRTHNAIHYGTAQQLPRLPVDRVAGDTKLW